MPEIKLIEVRHIKDLDRKHKETSIFIKLLCQTFDVAAI